MVGTGAAIGPCRGRPDAEIPAELHTDGMRRAALAAGLEFVANPVIGGALTMQNVAAQAERTVASLLSGGSDPVITKAPEGAWTSMITDKALAE